MGTPGMRPTRHADRPPSKRRVYGQVAAIILTLSTFSVGAFELEVGAEAAGGGVLDIGTTAPVISTLCPT